MRQTKGFAGTLISCRHDLQEQRAMSLSDVTATATNKGDISVIITDADGKRVQAEIPIELAEKLKSQIESALPIARIRANRR
jgi:hypothetical protein